jgi:hypothetical protein
MRIVGLLLVLLVCLIPVGVYAAGFGISPYKVDTQVEVGQSTDVSFTVSGFSGTIEVNSENLPVEIIPKTVEVLDSSKINLKLSCDKNTTPSLYSGKLVFLAKSGDSVQSGIKVLCNLTVTGDTIVEEQTANPTMLIIWVGFLVALLIGIVYLTYRFRNK